MILDNFMQKLFIFITNESHKYSTHFSLSQQSFIFVPSYYYKKQHQDPPPHNKRNFELT